MGSEINKNELIARAKEFAHKAYQTKKGQRDHINKIIDCVLWVIDKGVDPDNILVDRSVAPDFHELAEKEIKKPLCGSPFMDPMEHKGHMADVLEKKYNEEQAKKRQQAKP